MVGLNQANKYHSIRHRVALNPDCRSQLCNQGLSRLLQQLSLPHSEFLINQSNCPRLNQLFSHQCDSQYNRRLSRDDPRHQTAKYSKA